MTDQHVPVVLPLGPEQEEQEGRQADEHRCVNRRVVAEVCILEHIVEVDGVGLYEEAASEEGHVGAAALGILVRGLLYYQLSTLRIVSIKRLIRTGSWMKTGQSSPYPEIHTI